MFTGLYVALAMTSFTVLFGTRNLDATEHHHGLMLTIAFESAVKLLAFIAVRAFCAVVACRCFPQDRTACTLSQTLSDHRWRAHADPHNLWGLHAASGTRHLLSARQFHVMSVVVHNPTESMKTARLAFPAYLLVLSAFVVPSQSYGRP
ncbi:MAG: hypothetical protein IPM37_03425 [Hahellaceae bacterium]|nr:hypothetical protein [Hahellaceae bacterium]